MSENISKRNGTLDMIKLFAAYMVVFIHVPFAGRAGAAISTVASFAVPFFFMSSGYFCYGNTPEKIVRKILHIVRLYIAAAVVYNVYNVAANYIRGGTELVVSEIKRVLSFSGIVDYLLFNVTSSSIALWFFPALIYTYVLFWLWTKLKINENLLWAVFAVGIAVNVFADGFLALHGIVLPTCYTHNFLFYGFPFFSLGIMMNRHQAVVKKAGTGVAAFAFVAGVAIIIASMGIINRACVYFGILLMLLAIVVIFTKYSDKRYSHILIKLSGCSTYIYMYHCIIKVLIRDVVRAMGYNTETAVYANISAVIVAVSATLLALMIDEMLKKYKTAKDRQ